MFDTCRYYAFILDALARFPGEGRRISPSLWHRLPGQRGRKPASQLLKAVSVRIKELKLQQEPASILEFGVYKGNSSRILAGLYPQSQIYGFDTFSGLPEDGRKDWNVDFRVSALPIAPTNVEFVVGRFEDTLAPFLKRPGLTPIQLIHIDCDIFSSAHCVLDTLGSRIAEGTVIVFDELLNYQEFPENELLAFYLFLNRYDLDFEWFVTIGDALAFERSCTGEQPAGGFLGYRKLGFYQNTSVIIKSATGRSQRIAGFMSEAIRLSKLRPLQQPLLALAES